MNILSIQSEVVYGHVGNAAARFALQRQGHEVWALPTVLLSSHAGYPKVTGEALAPDLLAGLVDGLAANGWLARGDAVLSGYLGHRDQARVVADAVRRMKAANPKALFCLDPVFGDDGRAYAKPGVAEAMARELLPLADIVTPNVFELASLASVAIRDPGDAHAAAQRLGRPVVLATSVPCGGARIGTLAVSCDGAFLVTTPRLENPPHGAGDLLAAMFLAQMLGARSPAMAARRATGAVFRVLSESVTASSQELLLLECQQVLADSDDHPELRVERLA